MGDTRRFRKSFSRPFKPWDDVRIAEEKTLSTDYGLKNKRELWKTTSILSMFKAQAKNLIASKGPQAELEKQQLLGRLASLGLTSKDADLDTVLGLTINDLMNRRLQTIVFKKKLSKTIKQARQFIVHEHILVNEKKIAVPSYLVKKDEEEAIKFSSESQLANEMHPERVQKQATPEVAEEPKEKAETAKAETAQVSE